MKRMSGVLGTLMLLAGCSSVPIGSSADQPGGSAAMPSPGSGPAQIKDAPLSYVAGIGFGKGGDTILTAQYTDGSIGNIKAGNGLHVFGGLDYRLSDRFDAQVDAGYQAGTVNADNGELTFKKIPVELLAHVYLTPTLRAGAGVRFDEHVKLSGTGVASMVQQDFNSATGAIVEIEYLVTPHFGIKLRGVDEKFTPAGYTNKFSGNQLALLASLYF